MDLAQSNFTEAAILARVISPAGDGLSEPAAKALLGFEFAQSDIDHMNELAEKNRQGTATVQELSELEGYSRIGGLLNLLQAKARRSLAHG